MFFFAIRLYFLHIIIITVIIIYESSKWDSYRREPRSE
jgi:hypothetical protein